MLVKYEKTSPNSKTPILASEEASCWDVFASKIEIKDGFVICYLGFKAQFDTEHALVLVPRSSITNSSWVLQNSPGQGDPDYRGEYQYRFRAIPIGVRSTIKFRGLFKMPIIENVLIYPEFPYELGDRVGQVYLRKIVPIEWEKVKRLSNTTRGAGGFGHTGKK